MPNAVKRAPMNQEEPTKRQAILRAAAHTFLSRGFEGTSMELVAVESGAGRQTVYNQFVSKKALFDETVSHLWKNMRIDQIVSDAGSGDPPELALSRIGNAIADFWAPEEAVAFVRMVIAEHVRFPELGESYFKFGRDPTRRAVVQYLKKLHEAQTLNFSDPELAAAQFVGVITETMLWSRIVGRSKSLPKTQRRLLVEQAVQMLLCRYRRQ